MYTGPILTACVSKGKCPDVMPLIDELLRNNTSINGQCIPINLYKARTSEASKRVGLFVGEILIKYCRRALIGGIVTVLLLRVNGSTMRTLITQTN